MSERTREINRVTKAIITVSWKLIVCALAILLLYEVIVRGYSFGYGLFAAQDTPDEVGMDMRVTIGEDESLVNLAVALEQSGLVEDRVSFIIQCLFYEYGYEFAGYGSPIRSGTFMLNTTMTPKEIILTLRDGSGTVEEEESGAGAEESEESGSGESGTGAEGTGGSGE